MKKFLSGILVVIGISFFIISSYLFYIRNFSNKLSFESNPSNVRTDSNHSLSRIEIPAINKDLPIIAASINGTKWETTQKGVSYLSSTPKPGDKGNSIMYAHNWNTLLGELNKVKPNDEIIVSFNNGEIKKFVVENTAVVDPSQTDVIKNTNDTRLTLYTCTGFLDSKRLVVVAKPEINN